ncbi:hypothetical protein [Paenibacillus popilliae]|uniref:Hemolysin activation/secretion protein n=1 Tax=Paenibacillus popilliae ATCC 14706 TaxID=1212764 RepID=M9LBK5_PAEPP|nr:hypothetical protein [Paenibacillus popilliae]GAC43237.1 hemolysin activation/secretion protein [Paenibacillus popilliae ATCC 14706]
MPDVNTLLPRIRLDVSERRLGSGRKYRFGSQIVLGDALINAHALSAKEVVDLATLTYSR